MGTKAEITAHYRIEVDPHWYWKLIDMNEEVGECQGDGLTIELHQANKGGSFDRTHRITMMPEEAVALRKVLNAMKFLGE